MTFPAELERLLKEATEGPWLCIDLRPDEEKLTVTDGVTVVCRIKNSVRRGPIAPDDVANSVLICLLRNHADAILGLVRAAESAHQTLADEGFHAKALRLGQALAKLNGEGK